MNKGRERERSEIESKWISVTGQQPRHAFVTGSHDAAYHLLVNLPPELPSIRSNLFSLTDRVQLRNVWSVTFSH